VGGERRDEKHRANQAWSRQTARSYSPLRAGCQGGGEQIPKSREPIQNPGAAHKTAGDGVRSLCFPKNCASSPRLLQFNGGAVVGTQGIPPTWLRPGNEQRAAVCRFWKIVPPFERRKKKPPGVRAAVGQQVRRCESGCWRGGRSLGGTDWRRLLHFRGQLLAFVAPHAAGFLLGLVILFAHASVWIKTLVVTP